MANFTKQTLVHVLQRWSRRAFDELCEGLSDVSDAQSWWRVALGNDREYLHSSGSILGITLHLASCKVMYAEYAFGAGKVTWQDMAKRARQVEPSFARALAWLAEAQQLWLSSWNHLNDVGLSSKRKTNWGEEWETMRIIQTMIEHDVYHGGQIALIRAQLPLALGDVQPSSEADLWDRYLGG